jgi:hypothetical protein
VVAKKVFLTSKEVSTLTGISVSALEKGRAEFGNIRIPFIRIGRRIFYEIDVVMDYMRSKSVTPRQARN